MWFNQRKLQTLSKLEPVAKLWLWRGPDAKSSLLTKRSVIILVLCNFQTWLAFGPGKKVMHFSDNKQSLLAFRETQNQSRKCLWSNWSQFWSDTFCRIDPQSQSRFGEKEWRTILPWNLLSQVQNDFAFSQDFSQLDDFKKWTKLDEFWKKMATFFCPSSRKRTTSRESSRKKFKTRRPKFDSLSSATKSMKSTQIHSIH